ncbi:MULTISPECIES: response regulator [unclassified Pseudoalteromonas]|uniref:response regulator n=1 Tax=unclassified Pseudoalteromonas TaxID=194690 RepID=UPI002097527C|nr:response regulator [Pseudoalteromonas sp. XMcav2-N]MCO7186931.1 response regulator [Pseudoalteromonas sp. XMcav2-N]
MHKGEVDYGERHPKVLMICDDAHEMVGVCKVISSQVTAFRTQEGARDAHKVIREGKPPVLIFAMLHVKASIETYNSLAQRGLLGYPHKSILLCENKESGVAFRCCIKGIFNDYFVFKPMYENYRLRMILHNILQQAEDTQQITELKEEHFGRIDNGLKQLIDQAASYRVNTEQSFQQVRESLSEVQEEDEVNAQLLQQLKEKHVLPLLDKLQQQLVKDIQQITKQLNDSHFTLNELADLFSNSQASAFTSVLEHTGEHKEEAHHDEPEHDVREHEAPTQHADFHAHEDPHTDHAHNDESTHAFDSNDVPEPVMARDKRIMIVEDNEIYREMISGILREQGFSVDGMENGLAAIKELRKHRYDMIFMDLFMPGLDGYNTTKNVRAIEHCRGIPIVALTSNRNKDLIRKWATLGLGGYIVKPSTKRSILDAVNKLLGTECV